MFWAWARRRGRPIARRGIALLALCGFIASTIGVPVPALPLGKDLSQAFPCMHRGCGCRSAAQCWKGCCCFTNQQKLAWCAQNGVEPPAIVVKHARHERQRALAQKTHCDEAAGRGTCCQQDKASPPYAPAKASSPIEFVFSIHARKCQGQADVWLALGAVTAPPQPVLLALELTCCGSATPSLANLSSVTSSPATPPPRA
jgi:hypothetical protein